LPESGDGPKTLLRGLFGDARVRVRGLAVWGRGLEDRTDSFTPVLKGVKAVVCGVDVGAPARLSPGVPKSGVGPCSDVGYALGEVVTGAVGDDCGVVEGEASAEAEEPEAVRTIPNRDGDLDMVRRRDGTPAVMST
jgi:hypothetical protein